MTPKPGGRTLVPRVLLAALVGLRAVAVAGGSLGRVPLAALVGEGLLHVVLLVRVGPLAVGLGCVALLVAPVAPHGRVLRLHVPVARPLQAGGQGLGFRVWGLERVEALIPPAPPRMAGACGLGLGAAAGWLVAACCSILIGLGAAAGKAAGSSCA